MEAVMGTASKGGGGGGGDGDGERTGRWRPEEVFAGNREALKALRELVMYPVLYAREASVLGLNFPRGLLLHGPSGTGKKSMVRAVVRECNAHLTMIDSISVNQPHAGEGEKFLREAFTEAHSQASQGRPAVIFIDELDGICPLRGTRREQGSRIVGQLLTLMDGNKRSSKMLPHAAVELVPAALRGEGKGRSMLWRSRSSSI